MAVYSLSQYQLTLKLPNEWLDKLSEEDSRQGLVFGGSGSYLESFSFSLNEETWTTVGDKTGSWVHNFNGNKTGTCSISINQASRNATILNTLFNLYFNKVDKSGSYNQLVAFPTITLTNLDTGEIVVEAEDCVINKPSERVFGAEAAVETWVFNCGELTILGN